MKKVVILISIMLFLSIHVIGQEKHDIGDHPIPKNINQCFKILDKTMPDNERLLVKTLPEGSLYNNDEIGYETDFYNTWKINDVSKLTKYFNKLGLDIPFEINEAILVSYHRYLNNEEINLNSQIEKYNVNRRKESIEYQQKHDSVQRQYQLNKMINESMLSYLNYKFDLYRKVCKDCGEYTTYICVDNYPESFVFSKEILNKNVKFMSLKNLSGQKELKQRKKYGFIFSGIFLEKNQLIISLSSRTVSIPKKTHLNIGIIDWGIYTYDYSCEKQEWILIDTKYGGV